MNQSPTVDSSSTFINHLVSRLILLANLASGSSHLPRFIFFVASGLGAAWIEAFEAEMEYEEDQQEEGDEMMINRIQTGKRFKRVTNLIRSRVATSITGLVLLCASRALETWVHLLLRDTGAAKRLDWRQQVVAAGGDWRRESLWNRNIQDEEDSDDNDADDPGFEPTLHSLYSLRLAPLRRVPRELSNLLAGQEEEALAEEDEQGELEERWCSAVVI